MPQVRIGFNLDLAPESEWLTVTPAQAVRDGIAYVQEMGDFHCGPAYYTDREFLPSHLIKLCLGGEGTLEYDGQRLDIRPGDLFWIDCMKPQFYRTAEGGSWRLMWVHFSGAACDAYYRLFLIQNEGRNVVHPESGMGIRGTLEALMNLYRGGNSTLQEDIRASVLLTELMSYCIQAAGMSTGCRIPDYVMDARRYIDLHYARRITLEDLSHSLSINKFYLQKLFKRCIGLSPNEYLIHTRLTRAKQLLRTSSRPIGQICRDVGFQNVGHFISLFKRYEGIVPSAYRQQWYNVQRQWVQDEADLLKR